MSFRDLRHARTSRQSNKSFVVPHITDVHAWRKSVESPSDLQEQVKEEQLIWTVRNEEGDGQLEEEDELAYNEVEDLIEQDNIREKEEDMMLAPQLESVQPKQDAETKNAASSTGKPEMALTLETIDRSSSTPSMVSTIPTAPATGVSVSSETIKPASSSALYTEKPPTIEIKLSKERGRGLWTTKFIKAGTTIFTIRPHVHVLSRTQLDLFCSTCAGAGATAGLKRCGKCKVTHYCSTVCQNADWATHKIECEALRRWAASAPSTSAGIATSTAESQDQSDEDDGSVKDDQGVAEEYTAVPSEAIRCLARILWKRKKIGSNSTWWKEINEMQCHRDNIAQSMINAHVHLAHGIVRYMGLENAHDLAKYEVLGVGELVELISKFTSNSFTLATPSLSPIGVAISPLAALINHNCDPNVAIVFPHSSTAQQEPLIHAVAIQDIQPHTELFTSYIDITLPRKLRQKDLKETYNFTCECEICKPNSIPGGTQVNEGDWRERLWCPIQCGGTCPVPLTDDDPVRCSRCDTQVANVPKVMDNMRIGQDALDKANSLQFSDIEHALKLTRNTIPLLIQVGLPPSSHPLLALYRLQQNLLITSFPSTDKLSTGLLDEAICSAAKAAAGLESVLRPGHPVRAIALAELGKLLAVDEPPESSSASSSQNEVAFPPSGPARLQLAVQALRRAHTELNVAFGKAGENGGGAVGSEVHELLVNLEKELDVWSKRIGQTLKDTLMEQKGGGAQAMH